MSEISEQLQRLTAQVQRLEEERDDLRRRIAQEQDEQAGSSSPYLTVDQAAELARCNPKTIRRAVNSGRLRAFRVSPNDSPDALRPGRLRLLEADVRTWVESQAATPVKAHRPGQRRARRAAPGSVAAIRQRDPGLRGRV